MSLPIVNVFYLCIIVFSWLFGSVLCTRQSLANRFLGSFLLVLGLQMLQYLLFDLGLLLNYRWRGFLGIVFLYGPLIYGYVKALLQPDFSLSRRYGVHLLPTICCMVAGWGGLDVRQQLGWGLYLSLGFYLLMSFRLLLTSPVTARISDLQISAGGSRFSSVFSPSSCWLTFCRSFPTSSVLRLPLGPSSTKWWWDWPFFSQWYW